MRFTFALIFASLPCIFGQGEKNESCYFEDENPYNLFATKTSYFEVDNEKVEPLLVEGCSASSFWTVVRHGTRNPGDDAIRMIVQRSPQLRESVLHNHEQGRGQLCDADLNALRSWSLNLTESDMKMLTVSGEREQEMLGSRWRKRLPGLLDRPFTTDRYRFRSTKKQRAIVSAKAYAKGAFEGEHVQMEKPLREDPLLRFYDFCTKWEHQIDKSDSTYREQRLFLETSAEMASVMQRVADRLGFDSNSSSEEPLSQEDVFLMYDICRYGKAFFPNRPSPWCAAFDKDDLEVLEFYQDLEYWYKNGYYNELNYKMSCPLLHDLSKKFNLDAESRPLGTFYFAHSETVIPFLGLLGLYNDTVAPTHQNYGEMSRRKYRTSLIGSFTANVAFVRFECDSEPRSRIAAFHQERWVKLPRCSDDLCGWQEFQQAYKESIECPFDDFCSDGQRNARNEDSGPKSEASSKKGDENKEDSAAANTRSSFLGILIVTLIILK